MDKIIPLISSSTAGPLGIKHLPRLWLKTLLSAAGRLPAGYKDIRPGFDYFVLDGLGIDPDAAREFIFSHRPAYLAFERWLCEQPGVDVSAENIAKINAVIVGKAKDAAARTQIIQENGLPDDSPIREAVMLNNLDDWKAVHDQVTGQAGQAAA